jgi:hypothetical protein
VQRFAPALIALLAAVALVTAAGSFDAVDGPSVSGDSTPDGSVQRQQGGSAPPTPAGDESRGSYDGDNRTTAASADGGGGVSALLVAALLGTLVAGGVLIVFLTDDDTRAPERDDAPGGDDGPPTAAVDPEYGSPADSVVVQAWRALADRADADDAATPGETASEALDRGVPPEPVDRVTHHFEAVRYGRASPTEREDAVADVADAFADGDVAGSDWDTDGTGDRS